MFCFQYFLLLLYLIAPIGLKHEIFLKNYFIEFPTSINVYMHDFQIAIEKQN